MEQSQYSARGERPQRPAGRTGLVSTHISGRNRQATGTLGPGGLRVVAPLHTPPPAGGGPRGNICGFSDASRRRLMQLLYLVDWSAAPSFWCTLTFRHVPGAPANGGNTDYYSDRVDSFNHTQELAPDQARYAHACLLAWKKRLYRRWGDQLQGVVWKLELQERGVMHWHLVMWWQDAPELRTFRVWNDEAWNEVSAPGDEVAKRTACNVQLVRNTSGPEMAALMRYLSKYVGKPLKASQHTGRCWGVWGDPPKLVLAYMDIGYQDLCQLVRRVRRWGKRSPYLRGLSSNRPGFMLYGDGFQLVQLLRGLSIDNLDPGGHASIGLVPV